MVGGGFTGAAVAFHLARARIDADILVFEPRALLGAGLAYSGDDPVHRVNVPASRMSLLPDDEGHFARWLAATEALRVDQDAGVGGEFYPRRREFGRYVDAALRPYVEQGAVRHIRDRVVSLRKAGGAWRIEVESGDTFRRRGCGDRDDPSGGAAAAGTRRLARRSAFGRPPAGRRRP